LIPPRRRTWEHEAVIIAAQPTVEVVTAGTDWAAIVAAIVTGLAAIIGIAGTAWQASRARQAATADLKASIDAATANQQANIEAAAENTVRTLDAARDERIWDRRARAYEQSVAALLHRRQQRRQEQAELYGSPLLPADRLRSLSVTYALRQENISLPDHAFFDSYPGGWFEVEGTLLAYATPKVITALDAARQADDAARIALGRCRQLSGKYIALDDFLKDSDASPQEAPKPDANAQAELEAAAKALESALGEAEQKDNDLINAIRDELDAKPSEARTSASQMQPN
jgi:hypothetical protein